MIANTWCLFVVIVYLAGSSQAFLTTLISVHALSSYSIGSDRRMEDDKSNYIINDDDDSSVNDNRKEEVYVISLEASNASNYDNAGKKGDTNKTDKKSYDAGPYSAATNNTYYPDAWSISWYVSSFGGLVLFFLIVSFSEWYCRSNRTETTEDNDETTSMSREGPPPPYHLFAPPSYDSINEKIDHVYIIPIHRSTDASS